MLRTIGFSVARALLLAALLSPSLSSAAPPPPGQVGSPPPPGLIGGGGGHPISAPEFDLSAAGTVAAIVALGGVFIAARRRRHR